MINMTDNQCVNTKNNINTKVSNNMEENNTNISETQEEDNFIKFSEILKNSSDDNFENNIYKSSPLSSVTTLSKSLKKRKCENICDLSTERSKKQRVQYHKSEFSKKLNDIVEFEKDINYLKNIEYSFGSIVWAKTPGFFWWPAIVDNDPDLNIHFWYKESTDIISHYYVTILDDNFSRIWVSLKGLKSFCIDDETRNICIQECSAVYKNSLMKAIKVAEEYLGLEPKALLTKHASNKLFYGQTNRCIWSMTERGNTENDPDITDLLDLEASIIDLASNFVVTSSEMMLEEVSSDNEIFRRKYKRKKKLKRLPEDQINCGISNSSSREYNLD